MKYCEILKWAAATIVGFGASYLSGAFILFELNPGAWPEMARIAVLVMGLVVSWCSAGVLFNSGEGQ